MPADVFSAPSFAELRREALECERWNLLHPGAIRRAYAVCRATAQGPSRGPYIAATDYVRAVPDLIRKWVPGSFVTLGTDGFGRSDARAALRRHFEVDRQFIALAALRALADEGQIDVATVTRAMADFGIDADKANPLYS